MLQANTPQGIELHWLRTHAGVETTSRHFRPLMLAMKTLKAKSGTVHSLISEKAKKDTPSKAPRCAKWHRCLHQGTGGPKKADFVVAART